VLGGVGRGGYGGGRWAKKTKNKKKKKPNHQPQKPKNGVGVGWGGWVGWRGWGWVGGGVGVFVGFLGWGKTRKNSLFKAGPKSQVSNLNFAPSPPANFSSLSPPADFALSFSPTPSFCFIDIEFNASAYPLPGFPTGPCLAFTSLLQTCPDAPSDQNV